MLPTAHNIWEWTVKNFTTLDQLFSPKGNAEYSHIKFVDNKFQIRRNKRGGGTQDIIVSQSRIEQVWEQILNDGYISSNGFGPSTNFKSRMDIAPMTLCAHCFGWQNLSGLLFWDATSKLFHLRYIPVNLELFDSIMAELNLRKQADSSETTRIYRQSDWKTDKNESAWSIRITKGTIGFELQVQYDQGTTPIEFDNDVAQFATYEWSNNVNSNSSQDDPEAKFYISWPEKMLLQNFVGNQISELEFIQYSPERPKIFWCINSLDDNTAFEHIEIDFNIKQNNWDSFNIATATLDSFGSDSRRYQVYPFFMLIRPDDYCIRTPKHLLSLGQFTQETHGLARSIAELNNLSNTDILGFVQEKSLLSTMPEINYPNGTVRILKQQWASTSVLDGGFCKFTEGYSTTDEYPQILYRDFIEQRAQVLDPTSRALLIHLKNLSSNSTDNPDAPSHDDWNPSHTTNRKLLLQLLLSKNLILEGVPGTGKTFGFKHDIIEKWSENGGDDNNARQCQKDAPAITMHPSTSYEDFIEGLRPSSETKPRNRSIPIKESNNDEISTPEQGWFFNPPQATSGNFNAVDGFFTQVCQDAVLNPSTDFIVLLDEINRCNIPSVFGDLLTAIEKSKRAQWTNIDNENGYWDLSKAQVITLAISKRQFFVPENVYIVGTMNTTDRSVAPMDMALRRRFAFTRLWPMGFDPSNIMSQDEHKLAVQTSLEDICGENLTDTMESSVNLYFSINNKLNEHGPDALLGHSYLFDLASDLAKFAVDQQNEPITANAAPVIQHHWNHHILPQVADIIRSNQLKDVYDAICDSADFSISLNDETHQIHDQNAMNTGRLLNPQLILQPQ